MTFVDIVLLIAMLMASLWTVMTRSLLKSTIGLALTSAIITIIMFRLDSPLAAVFELSVCTGLITAVFVSTISLVKPLTHKEIEKLSKDRIKRFWYLPVIMVIVGVAMVFLNIPADFKMPAKAVESDVRNVLWNSRQIDIFGQIVVLLAGVFGIVLLFKEVKKK
jgi:NADH-quinone oxidoreductase subunit J